MATLSDPSGVSRIRVPSRPGDLMFDSMTRLTTIATLLLSGGIIISLIISSWSMTQKFNLSLLWNLKWDPPSDTYDALMPIYDTLVTPPIALIIVVPVSFGIALSLTELSPAWLRRPLGTAIELLVAVPSIMYGIWGLLVLASISGEHFQKSLAATVGRILVARALFQSAPTGIGLLCAGMILAIMIIPYVSAVMRDMSEVTSVLLKGSAYGVGCTTWEIVWNVVLPYTKAGMIGGVTLNLGRILGETMTMTSVIGDTSLLADTSPFSLGSSITSTLANEFAETGQGLHTVTLMELGLILSVITFIVLAASKPLLLRLQKNESQK